MTIALLFAAALASPAAAKDGNDAAIEPSAANIRSIEARCAAETSLRAEFQHCVAGLGTEWQQAQFDAARPTPKVKPDALDVELDWKPGQAAGLTEDLHLSLAGE
jgi:hypothetical protein